MKIGFFNVGIGFLAVVASAIVGAEAAWRYAEKDLENISLQPTIEMGIFNWQGSEILPDDVLGEDHQVLVDGLLNGDAGMNTEGSEINQQISSRQEIWWADRDTYGSMDAYDKESMGELFGLDTSNLSFMIYFPDATPNIRYIFTTSEELGSSGYFGSAKPNVPTGEYLYIVYRTTLNLNADGEWEAVKSERGYAKSAYYQNDIFGSAISTTPAFDVTTWTEGKRGTGFNDAVYAYVGLQSTVYTDGATESVYYKITPTQSGNLTLSSANLAVTIKAYDNKKKDMKVSNSVVENADGTQAVQAVFAVEEDATYYFSLTGDISMDIGVTLKG